MAVDSDTIDLKYVAHLARLQLSETEITKLSGELKDILGYIAKLNELELKDVEPTAHAIELSNVLREDCVEEFGDRSKILKNAPQSARNLFIVPKIIE